MDFNLGRCVKYTTESYNYKAYIIDFDKSKELYLIAYKEESNINQAWVKKDSLSLWTA